MEYICTISTNPKEASMPFNVTYINSSEPHERHAFDAHLFLFRYSIFAKLISKIYLI